MKSNPWHRNSAAGTIEAFQCIDLCVASPTWIGVLQTVLPKSFTNLGSTHIAGYSTWHLRSARSSGTGHTSHTVFNDFYLGRATHYLVRVRLNTEDARSYQVRTFSIFNVALTIGPPV